ncbi:cell division ATP-binding protein FtsE [Robinsoniella peoriensis]|uniref:cell division ATP-binding protein FtsE n=1 Tax=Robinsoniella peoriensis TaxID=180332 RepID=UPI00085BE198|nr:ATP-binding cassette domain-containing protein [Robinsoniella peoriensis]
MILLDKVTKVYPNGYKAIDNLSLKIEAGEFVFLAGNSGAGKTTLLDLMLKDTEPTSGRISINGIQLSRLKKRQIYRYRRFIGTVFQDFRLFEDFSVYENVAFAQRVVEAEPARIRERVLEVLELVGMKYKKDYLPVQLSGGERQKVAIARAIVNQPVLLLADEPTRNLDRKSAIEIMDLIERVNQKGTTVVVVSHNSEIIKAMDKRVITFSYGRIISDSKWGGYLYGI